MLDLLHPVSTSGCPLRSSSVTVNNYYTVKFDRLPVVDILIDVFVQQRLSENMPFGTRDYNAV